MGKPRKRSKHKVGITPSKPAPAAKPNWFSQLPTIWKTLIFVLGIPGLYVGLLSALPRLSVKSSGTDLHSDIPLSAPFEVSNDGYLALHDVRLTCKVENLESSRTGMKIDDIAAEEPVNFPIGDLGPDGSATTFCAIGIGVNGGQFDVGLMNIFITFRPDFLPWHQSKVFHFTMLTGDGTPHWVRTSH